MGQPFNGDSALLSSVDTLIEAFGVQTIVETGTYTGQTTDWLAGRRTTHSIEIDADLHLKAQRNLADRKNLTLHLGSSPDVIAALISQIKKPALFYLDAHWNEYWPLLDEIKALAPIRDAIIVIHDFKVPGTTFGFDCYKGKQLDIDYIRPTLDSHFSCWRSWYNRTASGAKRGVCYILTGELGRSNLAEPIECSIC